MAETVSVDVETNGLGTAKVFYGSGNWDGYAEVHFFPKFGVLIDYEYHYEFTQTYKPEIGGSKTLEGYDTFFGSPSMVEDENCPFSIICQGGDGDYIVNKSWKITITGSASVFPYKVIPEGRDELLIWFYRRPRYDGEIEFYWKCKVALDGYEFLMAIFFYSSDEQIPNEKYGRGWRICLDEGFAKCTFWFRKFTYLPMYDEKSKKLISFNYFSLLRDGDIELQQKKEET